MKRSKRYRTIKKKLNKSGGTVFSIKEAIAKIKEGAGAKFDESIEVHIKLNLNEKEGVQVIRGTVNLPKDIGRKRVIAAFVTPEKVGRAREAGAKVVGGEDLILKIKETKKINFDLALAESSMMRHLGQIGKILGQKGLMPNPKNETVSPKIISAIREFAAGKISFKSDDQSIVHGVIGKISFENSDLIKNYEALLTALKKQTPENQKGEFIESISICSTMGPGLLVKV